MADRKIVDEAAVVALLERGGSYMEVAVELGLSEGRVARVAARHSESSPAFRERLIAHRAARAKHARKIMAAINAVQVPGWVKRADLESDFRDTARDFGEDAALRHCRRLIAEMRLAA
ncbi:hypothetical protein ASF53_19500 [Methylobacterium sp. Leaf123]|uniref:hypothetical protein n=1 Tax=Methylobacterium sp. Leaf123 TaxID=1736264 RepID=UPI0006F6035F|nr:hypothetical protein [Methylobacterium sp. Leaf123]KQQ29419.1 hypothetical protein ASF53_19500 [Methylobacterium sp. Leaf123]